MKVAISFVMPAQEPGQASRIEARMYEGTPPVVGDFIEWGPDGETNIWNGSYRVVERSIVFYGAVEPYFSVTAEWHER